MRWSAQAALLLAALLAVAAPVASGEGAEAVRTQRAGAQDAQAGDRTRTAAAAATATYSHHQAYATLLYGDDFLLGVRVLGQSLRETGTDRCAGRLRGSCRMWLRPWTPARPSGVLRRCLTPPLLLFEILPAAVPTSRDLVALVTEDVSDSAVMTLMLGERGRPPADAAPAPGALLPFQTWQLWPVPAQLSPSSWASAGKMLAGCAELCLAAFLQMGGRCGEWVWWTTQACGRRRRRRQAATRVDCVANLAWHVGCLAWVPSPGCMLTAAHPLPLPAEVSQALCGRVHQAVDF